MTRSGFRRLWLLVLIALLGASYMVYKKTTDKQLQIDNQMRTKDRLVLERESSRALADKLNKIDALTLHEGSATRLDILKFLVIEEDRDIKFSPGMKISRSFDGAEVFERSFTLEAEMPYTAALSRIDGFYSDERITIDSVVLRHVKKPGDMVSFTLEGRMFALDKGRYGNKNILRRKR